MESMGGQLADWNFELRGAQSWVADEDRWQYDKVKSADAKRGILF